MEQHCLPDLLQPALKVVFCGTAAGRASAKSGCYYAHSKNKFWEVLAKTRLTDRQLKPSEFMELTKFGIGLTDLCKNVSGNDSEIPPPTAEQREVLRKKLHAFKPTFLAFTSLEAGKRFVRRKVHFGLQADRIGESSVYVLPSTSLMAAWNWKANSRHWNDLAHCVVR